MILLMKSMQWHDMILSPVCESIKKIILNYKQVVWSTMNEIQRLPAIKRISFVPTPMCYHCKKKQREKIYGSARCLFNCIFVIVSPRLVRMRISPHRFS